MWNGPTNALVCNKTLIKMSHIKTFKITPTCSNHQLIIIRELFDPSYNHCLKLESSSVVMRQHTFIRFACCIVWRGMSTCRHASPHSWTITHSGLKCTVKQWNNCVCFCHNSHACYMYHSSNPSLFNHRKEVSRRERERESTREPTSIRTFLLVL
jgi:hypothetical protein